MTPCEIADALTKAEREAFLFHPSDEWHRLADRLVRKGGRWANQQRRYKFIDAGLLEHKIDAGAVYRLTPLGLAVRAVLLDGE